MAEEKARLEGFTKRGEPRAVPDTERPPLAPGGEARISKGLIRAQERAGAFGGGSPAHDAPVDDIREFTQQRLMALEQRFSIPKDDDSAVEEIRNSLEGALTYYGTGNREIELRQLRALQTEIETKLGCLQIYLGPWLDEAVKGGAAAFKPYSGIVDSKNIFSLLKDPAIAGAFSQLIELGCQINDKGVNSTATITWDVFKETLRQQAKTGKWSKQNESAALYAFMLFGISGLHAEAASESVPGATFPGWARTDYEYALKGTVNPVGWFYWQDTTDEFRIAFHKNKARQFRTRGVDPIEPNAVTSNRNRQKIPQGISMRTGEEATHGDIYYSLGNYLQFGVDWDKQLDSVKEKITKNRERLNRANQDLPKDLKNVPKGLEELRNIDWTQVDLSPRTGGLKSRYELYNILRWSAEATENFIGNEYRVGIENTERGANLAAVYQAFKSEKAFRDLFDAERGLNEVAAWQSEALWTYNMPYILTGGALRSYDLAQMVNGFCNQGGDADKWLELYGRHFGMAELQSNPISPWQAAFMLLRIYNSRGREAIKADGQSFFADEILNKAAERWGWHQYVSASGARGQTFIQYLTELEAVARAYDNHDQGVILLTGEELTNLDQRAATIGVTKGILRWDISAIERAKNPVFQQVDPRMSFLLNTFSERLISNYGQWLYQYWEEPIKLAIGYHRANENEIYWKHRELEQIWAGLAVNLRKFSADGLGDRMQEVILGPRLVTLKEQERPGEKHEYIPPEQETERNMMFWMEGFWTRRIEYLMVLMSEEFSLRETAYHKDPETAEEMRRSLAVPSCEDRYMAIGKIMALVQREGARFFSPKEREKYMKRFHCTLWDNIRHAALRRALGIREPIGIKEEKKAEDGEKRAKGFFSQLGVPGKIIGAIVPLPVKNPTEFFASFGLYGVGRAGLAVVNSLVGNVISMSPWLGLGTRIALPLGLSIPLELSWPFVATVYLTRFIAMPIVRLLMTRLGNLPGVRKILGVRESRVNVMQRLQTVHTVMGGG